MDHTPILTWLIDGLRYLLKLADEYNGTAAIQLVAGLSGFNMLLRRYIDESAPMTKDQANRLEELGNRLLVRLTALHEQLDEKSMDTLNQLELVIRHAKEKCEK